MPLTELTELAARRARLDDRELDLIDRARRDGATWAQVAAALGLASRQAAEQRRHRLAAAARQRLHHQDARYGPGIVQLRAAIQALSRQIGDDPAWERRFVRAALVRDTVATAAAADPGALFSLAALAAVDLAAVRLPPPLTEARAALRLSLRAALTSTKH